MSGVYKNVCPDCGAPIRVRNSVGEHELFRAVYLECTSIVCGATFRAAQEITHRLSPPSVPNPKINLPVADATMRRLALKKEQDKQMDFEDLLNDSLTQVS